MKNTFKRFKMIKIQKFNDDLGITKCFTLYFVEIFVIYFRIVTLYELQIACGQLFPLKISKQILFNYHGDKDFYGKNYIAANKKNLRINGLR